jgi:threonine 3-dehydrogenase
MTTDRMTTLVTGAAGQVGLDLLERLVADRAVHGEVHATDVVARPGSVAASLPWHQLDVTDAGQVEQLLARVRPAVVHHLAAVLSATGERDPQRAYAVNQTGTWNVLEACRRTGVSQLVFASTIAAFGPGLPDPVPNEVSMRPTTMYGVTKVAGELLGEYYAVRYGLDFRGVRFPGLVNAGVPGGGTSDYALHMYVTGLREGRYEAFCHEDTRIPLMYMPDAVRALVDLSRAPRERLGRRVYNLQGFSPTAGEIAESVRRAVPGVEITFRPDPVRQAILDSWPRALDDRSARDEWGFAPRYDLEAMTADLVQRVREMLAVEKAAS